MLASLNRNAAAIQAIASIASVLITVALVWITSRYVALTQQLARAAREQLRIQRQSAVSELAQLLTLTDVFLGTLAQLPESETQRNRMSEVAVWKRSDVMTLATTAASAIGTEAPVHQCVQSLNWLRDKLEQAQQGGEDALKMTPWPQWQNEIRLARAGLVELRRAADDAQRTLIQEVRPPEGVET